MRFDLKIVKASLREISYRLRFVGVWRARCELIRCYQRPMHEAWMVDEGEALKLSHKTTKRRVRAFRVPLS